MKKRFFLLIVGSLLLKTAISQEFLVIQDTIDWTMSSPHGYHFYEQDYIQSLPQNWKSPYDYYNGEFYFRFEIVSEATSEPCGLQFGIWQYRIDYPEGEKFYSETMSGIYTMNGPGSVVYSNSSPTVWWRSYEGVDFSRVSGFWRLGINIWSLDPRSVIANTTWGGSEELWSERSKWFPIKVYVIVVAVAQGQTFSGWGNYYSPPSPPPVPEYDIDYINELTDKTVPSTDEYAYNSSMNDAVSGNGEKLQLTPGQDVYFRTKAQGSTPASEIQHMEVFSRPEINTSAGDTISDDFFVISIDFEDASPDLDAEDFYSENCTIEPYETNSFKIYPVSEGDVKIAIEPNVIAAGNFASDTLKVYYKNVVTITTEFEHDDAVILYPQPASSYVTLTVNESIKMPLTVRIYDLYGRMVYATENVYDHESIQVDKLAAGNYYLVITTSDHQKFVKKLVINP